MLSALRCLSSAACGVSLSRGDPMTATCFSSTGIARSTTLCSTLRRADRHDNGVRDETLSPNTTEF
jgi:hypothetical protein